MARSLTDEVRRHAQAILEGTVLAVDPASGGTSLPGWAAYRKGKFLSSGTVPINPRDPIQDRLRVLYDQLLPTDPDVLVIERIRGSMAHEYLRWSCGVIVASCRPVILLECPTSTWRSYAGKDHVKSDENDARAIGDCVLHMARAHAKA